MVHKHFCCRSEDWAASQASSKDLWAHTIFFFTQALKHQQNSLIKDKILFIIKNLNFLLSNINVSRINWQRRRNVMFLKSCYIIEYQRNVVSSRRGRMWQNPREKGNKNEIRDCQRYALLRMRLKRNWIYRNKVKRGLDSSTKRMWTFSHRDLLLKNEINNFTATCDEFSIIVSIKIHQQSHSLSMHSEWHHRYK